MSGIEVAGIALAVFPIILSGISHFVEGIETIKRWQRYRVRLLSYADVIEAQKVYYLDTLEGLLIDIVDSEDDMTRLMAEPGGVFWQKAVYTQRLKDRLDRSHSVFFRVIKDILQNLSGMCRKLGVGTGGEVCLDRSFCPHLRAGTWLACRIDSTNLGQIDTLGRVLCCGKRNESSQSYFIEECVSRIYRCY